MVAHLKEYQLKEFWIMKKIALLIVAIVLTAMPMAAQNYRQSRYYNPRTGHLDYGRHDREDPGFRGTDTYFGLRLGPSFSYVSSDDSRLNGGDWQTGLNVGAVVGIPLSNYQPIYFETGLFYTEKGGKKNLDTGKKMTYSLNYLEVPLVVKYKYNVDPHFSIQPQVGGYLACGVGGKIKNFEEREAENSFSKDNFQRFDGGIRIGCGMAYDMFYCDLTYDIGLANICHDTFDKSRNGGLQLNFGVNF